MGFPLVRLQNVASSLEIRGRVSILASWRIASLRLSYRVGSARCIYVSSTSSLRVAPTPLVTSLVWLLGLVVPLGNSLGGASLAPSKGSRGGILSITSLFHVGLSLASRYRVAIVRTSI